MNTIHQFVKRRPCSACAFSLCIGVGLGAKDPAFAMIAVGITMVAIWLEAKIMSLVLCVAACLPAFSQTVAVWPTNYSQTVTTDNNLGRIWPVWHTSTKDTIVLGARVLTIAHVVYFNSPLYGSKLGAPKRSEERLVYRQIGAATYRPIGGENILFICQKSTSDWLATTNLIMPEQIQPVTWLPDAVGTLVEGDGLWRTTRTASPLVCWGRNLASSPRMVRFPCSASTGGFNYDVRFEKNQIKTFAVDLRRASFVTGDDVDWFTMDSDYRDWELAF